MAMKDLEQVCVESNWCWLRAYYFEDCKDALILEGVWPAVRDIQASDGAARAYFERDWIGGPNILLGLNRSYLDLVEPITKGADRIRAYIEKSPSRTDISQDEFRRRTERLAVLEAREPGASEVRLQPNNTVIVNSREPYSPLLNPGALRQTVRQFLCDSSEIVVKWLGLVRDGTWQRHQIGLQAMIGLAWLANPENLRSHISFRSHANGFLRFMDSTRRLEKVFSQCYTEREGETMRRLLIKSVEALRSRTNPLPGMNDYLELLQSTMTDIYNGIRSGRLSALPAAHLAPPDPSDPKAELYAKLWQEVDEDLGFQSWRITINLLYLMLNQLGLAALDRYLACYMVSRAAEDVYGEPVSFISAQLARPGGTSRVITFFEALNPNIGGNVTSVNPRVEVI